MASRSFAQDATTLDQEKKLYQDALTQLKAAQDRKNELDSEKAKLTARIAELESQNETYRHQATSEADRTYVMRARLAGWETFLRQNPDVLERWRAWLDIDIKRGTWSALGNWDWPF
ncbi:MAG: hypothetical protein JO353_11215 [Phycisphaerae bacterium]|nr:hypothetical protein [Phycisphaerae bacterium]